jgi:hypothetical protein
MQLGLMDLLLANARGPRVKTTEVKHEVFPEDLEHLHARKCGFCHAVDGPARQLLRCTKCNSAWFCGSGGLLLSLSAVSHCVVAMCAQLVQETVRLRIDCSASSVRGAPPTTRAAPAVPTLHTELMRVQQQALALRLRRVVRAPPALLAQQAQQARQARLEQRL